MSGSRTKLLLGILGVFVLIGLWTTLSGDDEAPPPTPREGRIDPDAPGAASANLPRGGDKTAPVRDVVPLRIADLERASHSYTPGRDPWRFVDPPPPPPPEPRKPTKAEEEARRRAQEEQDRLKRLADEQARLEALKPKAEPFTMKYLGSFGPPERRIAVFTDGKTIYDAQQGETIAGKFIIAQIGYESVDIGYVPFPFLPPQRVAVGH